MTSFYLYVPVIENVLNDAKSFFSLFFFVFVFGNSKVGQEYHIISKEKHIVI